MCIHVGGLKTNTLMSRERKKKETGEEKREFKLESQQDLDCTVNLSLDLQDLKLSTISNDS